MYHLDALIIIMNAKTRIKKWGNSYAVRIPSLVIRELGVSLDDEVEMEVGKRGVLIKKPRKTLNEMLANINKDNIHPETDWGFPVGKEIW